MPASDTLSQLPIFVINLDRAPEGWGFVCEQFARVGLQPLRFAACDAQKDGFASPGYRPFDWRDRWELKLSERGVFESHRALWQRVADDCPQGAVICEDDILVSRQLPSALALLDLETFGVVKLDGCSAARRYGGAAQSNGLEYRPILEPVPSAGCYAISQSAARRLVQDSETYCDTADDFVFAQRDGVNPVQLWPAVSVQPVYCRDDTVSDMPDTVMQSERNDRPDASLNKGPLAYRALKELRRSRRRKNLRAIAPMCPPMAADLPPYKD